MSDATKRTTFEGFRTTVRTVAMLKEARRLYKLWGGHGTIAITQGGWNGTNVAASAGTHGKDCLDLSIRFMSSKDKGLAVKALRTVGFAAWHRYYLAGVWPEHCHAVPKGGDLARGAAAQVTSFRNGRSGLVGNARDSSIGSFAKVTWESYLRSAVKTKKLAKPTTYYVISKTLRGRSEAGVVKYTRARGFAITVTKLVTKAGQTWAVSNYGTWYLTAYGNDKYLSTKNPLPAKPAPKPAAPKPAPAKPAPAPAAPAGKAGLRPAAAAVWPRFCAIFEGRLVGMYLDTKALVTTGTGNLIDPVSKALELPWLTKAGKPASAAEVRAEWAQMKARKSLAKAGGYAFVKYQQLHLADADVTKLLFSKTDEFIASFSRDFPAFASWPADAQLAAMDLMWQNGPKFGSVKNSKGYVWPNMRAAFLAQDWSKAAKAVPGSGRRRNARVRLFTNAAAVKAWKLDPSVLWDTTKPVKPAVKPPASVAVKQAFAAFAALTAATGGTVTAVSVAPAVEPAPQPAVTVTVTASPTPAPAVTVTASPAPSKPKPADVGKKTVYRCKAACTITLEPKKK